MDLNELDDSDILNIIKIQSYCRGNYVRNELKKLRKDYEDILVEVEGADTDTQVIWPSNTNSNEFKLCYPKFSSKKGKNNTSATNTHDNSPVLSSRSQTQSNKKDENCNNTTAATSAVETSENSNKTKTNKELLNLDIDEKQLNCLQTENLKRLNRGELVELKENVSLEILWIQQAIQSRIQYLNLKRKIDEKKKQQSS